VVASLTGRPAKPLHYRTKGVVAELGQREAVAITLGVRWRGFPAWLIARTYHLLLMPGIGRRLRLLMDWNVALLFGRDAASPGRLGSRAPLEDGGLAQAPPAGVSGEPPAGP
jgi:NADH dehydrogenase